MGQVGIILASLFTKKETYYFIGGIIVIILVVVYTKKIKDWIKSKEDLDKSAQKEIIEEELTFKDTPSIYSEITDTIYKAMYNPGTDYDAIIAQIKRLKTTSDWKQIEVIFGTRVGAFTYYMAPRFEGNIIEWFADEFTDSSKKGELNALLMQFGTQI